MQDPPLIFVSDLHLDPSDLPRIEYFIDFCHFVAERKAILYILGDLFNFWAGDAQARIAAYRPLIRALRLLSQRAQLVFLHGNRDFFFTRFWQKKGGQVIYDGAQVKNGPDLATVYHGDAFCTGDATFQKIRSWYNCKWPYILACLLPASACVRIGRKFREMSKQSIASKYRDLGADFDYISAILQKSAASIMVCGHFHQRKTVHLQVAGKQAVIYFLPESVGREIHYLFWQNDRFTYRKFERDQ